MRVLVAILLMAVSVHAQSVADAARKERERRANLKATQVITVQAAGSASATTQTTQVQGPKKPEESKLAIDPVKEYNDRVEKLRAKILSLQDEQTALQLQINELNNQVYAPVVDQAAKDQALAVVGTAQQRLIAVQMELDETRKALEAMQLQGPPQAPPKK